MGSGAPMPLATTRLQPTLWGLGPHTFRFWQAQPRQVDRSNTALVPFRCDPAHQPHWHGWQPTE